MALCTGSELWDEGISGEEIKMGLPENVVSGCTWGIRSRIETVYNQADMGCLDIGGSVGRIAVVGS